MTNDISLIKGAAITSLVFSAGTGIILYILKQYHTDKVSQARIEGVKDFISFSKAAKYAYNETQEE